MTTTTATAFHSVSSPNDPLAQAFRQVRKAEYLAWRQALPTSPEGRERDFIELSATITRSNGMHSNFIAANLYALDTLDQLPRLRALIETYFHVDMARLRSIDLQLTGIPVVLRTDQDFWECLDERLSDLLTPAKPNELLPVSGTITKAIKSVIKALTPEPAEPESAEDSEDSEAEHPAEDSPTAPEPPPENDFTSSFRSTPQTDGSVMFEIRTDQGTATKIEEAVRARASSQAINFTQAFIEIFLMSVTVAITLNLYKAKDLPDAPGFLQPFGTLDPRETEAMAAAAKLIRDADAAGTLRVNSYQATAALRAAVEGRDGVCRWPGCNRPASRSQLDHRINYRDGGPTSADNLLSLCQTHHNRKTDEQVHYLLDPYTGDVYWLFSEGTWTVNRAEGPLAPNQKHWNQTLAQRQTGRQERARAKERERAEQEAKKRPRPSKPGNSRIDDEEPPF
ncbi:HNH endonuclease signature motif containing protein [Corynebacterium sp. A21]|uniref:HNH endonuclease signature motif containing protein n=1 Tax=Corynebacterium sp. A21 TaxID=3457318 RepID=UPI003FCFE585